MALKEKPGREYVDVMVRRWEAYSQQEATLEGDGHTLKLLNKHKSAPTPIETGVVLGAPRGLDEPQRLTPFLEENRRRSAISDAAP
jgi:hypothetical protein